MKHATISMKKIQNYLKINISIFICFSVVPNILVVSDAKIQMVLG